MIKGILFDLDGTLFNTLVDLQNAVNYSLNILGYENRTLEEVRMFIGNGINKLVERSLPDDDKTMLLKAISLFKEYYNVHAADNTTVYDNIYNLLYKLKELSIKTCVVTNKNQYNADLLIDKYFNGLMDYTIGVGEDGITKPDKRMCLKALDMLKLSNDEVLYVGDTIVDFETANNANIKCISCSWGYRDIEDLKSFNENNIINDPLELINFIN